MCADVIIIIIIFKSILGCFEVKLWTDYEQISVADSFLNNLSLSKQFYSG